MSRQTQLNKLTKFFFLALVLLFLPVEPVVRAQSNQLPTSQFPRYSNNYKYRNSVSGTEINNYRLTTPGVHLTKGEMRSNKNRGKPYNPGEPKLGMKWVRWSRQKMPLRIWISPGLELPKVQNFSQLQQTRVDFVFSQMQRKALLNNLPVAKGWNQDMNYAVAAGIEKWRIFEQEGLLKFGFTTDPYKAHVMIFYTDQFLGTSGPGGINVGANTSAQLFTPTQVRDPRYRQKPVIIEFNLSVNSMPEKIQGAAAHEFGHALGIKAHSPYRDDIMYADRIVSELSEGDKATLRLLYKSKTPYLM